MARLVLPGLCVVLVYSGFLAAAAHASPIWLLNGSQLSSRKTVTSAASNGNFKFPGITTTCSTTSLEMEIENHLGIGEGEVTDMNFSGCSTNGVCTVEAIGPENLPWPLHLETILGADYVIVEAIDIVVVYGNPECVLYETEVVIDGSAGGLFTNGSPASLAFSPLSLTDSGTEPLTFGIGIDWSATFFPLSVSGGGALSVG